ncbi:MAG: 2OG-Fe(II) oxygenase [Pseudomonadota bacterium]
MADLLIGRTGPIKAKQKPAAQPAAASPTLVPKAFDRPIDPGDRLPNFLLPNQRREADPFYDVIIGRPILLHLFVGTGEAESAGLRSLAERHSALAERGIDVVGMVVATLDATVALAESLSLPFDLFADPQARIRQRLGLGKGVSAAAKGRAGATITLALHPGLRVLGRFDQTDVKDQIDAALALLPTEPPPEAAPPITQAAPVLLLPEVLDAEFCARLIEEWRRDNEEGVALTIGADGKEHKQIDYGTKRRRDHYIHDKKLLSKLNAILFERVAPMISAAYDAEITGIEEFKVVCYRAEEGGYFRPHRDNTIPARAQRRFAMSINLNDGFQGGDLRFPEFGPESYRPGPGGAAVFSCSLLHEVLDMRQGERFSLLTFLTDATGPRRRADCKNWFETEGRALEQALIREAKA